MHEPLTNLDPAVTEAKDSGIKGPEAVQITLLYIQKYIRDKTGMSIPAYTVYELGLGDQKYQQVHDDLGTTTKLFLGTRGPHAGLLQLIQAQVIIGIPHIREDNSYTPSTLVLAGKSRITGRGYLTVFDLRNGNLRNSFFTVGNHEAHLNGTYRVVEIDKNPLTSFYLTPRMLEGVVVGNDGMPHRLAIQTTGSDIKHVESGIDPRNRVNKSGVYVAQYGDYFDVAFGENPNYLRHVDVRISMD